MSYLNGRAVVISGASSGIGAFLARELVARGCRVGLLARREPQLRALAEELRSAGGTACWAVADVADELALAAALDQIAEELGGTDIIIANAGYGKPEVPHRFEPGAAARMYDVNVLGMLHMIDWAMPRFLEQGSGHVVGVASLASYIGAAGMPSYCGTKAAMRVHLQGLRVTLANYNIAVTTICPGFVKSELTEENRQPMPFLWETDRAARTIADAIEKKRGEVAFPWQLATMIQAASRLLPTSWLEALMRRRAPRKR